MKLGTISTLLALLLTTSANATNTLCAFVRKDVPDGYLNLRASPSTEAAVLAKLMPGDFLLISTGTCYYRFETDGRHAGEDSVCAPEGSKWVPVENAPRFDQGGWINEGYVDWVTCGWNE